MSVYAEPNAGEKICKDWIQRRLGENKNAFPEMDIQLLFLVWIWGEEKELFKKIKHQTTYLWTAFSITPPGTPDLTYAGNVVMSHRAL